MERFYVQNLEPINIIEFIIAAAWQEVLPSEVAYKYHISYGSCAEKKMCRYCGKYFHPSYLMEHEANHKEVRR